MISINLDNALIITQGLINHLTIKELPGGKKTTKERRYVIRIQIEKKKTNF